MEPSSSKVAEANSAIAQLALMDASNVDSQADIISKCQTVISALQNPAVVVADLLSSQTTLPCLTTLSNMGAFEKLSSSEGSLTARQLAQNCAADEELIVRLMRIATVWGCVSETGPRCYAANGVTNKLAAPSYVSGLRFVHFMGRSHDCLPEYFKEIEYRNPSSNNKSPFQFQFETDLGLFEWMAESNPEMMRDFSLFMTTNRSTGQPWTTHFDVKHRILGGVKVNVEAPLFVDIGGGIGHDLRLVKEELGHLTKGQLVVEDTPSIINSVPDSVYDANFTYLAHDFFSPQPTKGARIYNLKNVIHDWPDDKALIILRHTAACLNPEYSKIWIIDRILPETDANKLCAWQDICMLATLGALERTQEQWDYLLAQAGLRITDTIPLPDGFYLIEAVLDA
ncbi:S-adenosyl-L-methionine-dependent methyltransferase [Aspergillus undulatus]|uniref:S-adenosyl-L-methionine-dependent methyltransferase n=1 Tax=Aspergillus undulatus TaxID=1810928 RepID=UPI003CCCF257